MRAITEPCSVFRKPFKPEEFVSEFHETDSKNAREISEAEFGWAQGFELRVDPSFWKDHNVQVIIRLRPLNCSEISLQGQNRCVRQDSCQALTWIGHPESRFTFDFVADEYVSQEKLFKEAGVPMVENCMAGYNSCIFAYGQTGSGKTHTMLGDIEGGIQKSSANCGMTLRVFEYLFSRIQKEKDIQSSQKLHFTCRCSFLEIYNEHIFDLLDPSSTNLQVREDAKKGVHVENLKEFEVSSPTDVIQQLIQGAANRKVASTNMNHASSRSHSVFTCVIERKWESQGVIHHRFARLNLVDLAGSERQKSSGAEGDRLKEATNINKSLSTLGLVIMNLVTSSSKRQLHVPYRDSKLTFLLQDSLGGNSKTMIIANISPSSCCAFETLSTLKFAQRAKFIRNNAIVNEEASGDVLTLRLEIRHLKKEVNRLRGLCNGGFDNLESDTITESIQGSPAILKLNEDQILYSPLTFDKRLSPRKEYEAALVTALRRIHDKEEELKALAAERNATDQMILQQTKEISSLKLTLRFREDAIKRLEGLASSKMSPEAHISQEREALLKEIEVFRNHVDRSSEVTKFARENVQLREELKRLKSFVEDGERVRMDEQITVLQDKLLEALDWKLMHEKNSEDHALFSWDSSVNEENEFLHLEAIQNQREAEALRKNLTICLEAKERLERRVDELTAQLDVEQKKADSQRQESQLLNPVVVSDHPMELKTMVDAITAAINREAEAREMAITLARENEELHMKLKNMYEDNTKLIGLHESTDIKTTSDETGVTYQDDNCNIREDKKAEDLEQQLREMLEENEKLLGLYERAMQERDDFKRMLASYELATIKAKDGVNCPEKHVEGNGLSKEVLGAVLVKLDPIYKVVKISGLIEKAANDLEAIYGKFEVLDRIAVHKKQEIKALSLPLSELEEKKTIANNKLLALKTVLERFSSEFDDCEERDVSAKYRYESCLGSWEQKNKELQRFRFLKGETDAGFTKAKQFEAELRNNLDQLKLQLQVTETQRKENERVLLSIDNLNPSESRTLSFGKATELLKSEEDRTKLGMEMKKLREKLASIQKDLANLHSKSESLSSKIENVEAELAIESTVLQESEFACGRIAEEKQTVCSMIEDGMLDFGRILVGYQECIFQADLKKCEIELLEDELKLEMKQMEELKSGQKVALENLRILIEDNRYTLSENDLDDSASEIKRLLSCESCHF